MNKQKISRRDLIKTIGAAALDKTELTLSDVDKLTEYAAEKLA